MGREDGDDEIFLFGKPDPERLYDSDEGKVWDEAEEVVSPATGTGETRSVGREEFLSAILAPELPRKNPAHIPIKNTIAEIKISFPGDKEEDDEGGRTLLSSFIKPS